MKKLAIILILLFLCELSWSANVTQMNGTNQYFIKTSAPDYNTPPMTFVGWINPDVNNSSDYILSLADTAGGNDYLQIYISSSSSKVVSVIRDSLASYVATLGTISTGTWHMIAFVWEADHDVIMYMDGTTNTDNVNKTPDGFDVIAIGRENDDAPGNYYDGGAGYFAFWYGTALSTGDLDNLYDNSYYPNCHSTAPTSYWTLEEASGTDTYGVNDLTPTNSPTTTTGPSLSSCAGGETPNAGSNNKSKGIGIGQGIGSGL